MKEVLVLGGTKFFGKKLVGLLLKDNSISVTIATRGLTEDSFGDKVKRLQLNREDRESVNNALQGKTWDVVYDQSCYSANAALFTCEALAGRVKRYIFTSSAAVYTPGEMLKEDAFDPYNYPIDIKGGVDQYQGFAGYTEAKRVAEAILFQRGKFQVVAARVCFVVGEDDYTKRFKFHVDHVKQGLKIGMNKPEARISIISSDDVARFLYTIGMESEVTGTFNPASPTDISLEELVRSIESALGMKAQIVPQQQVEPEHKSPYDFGVSLSIDVSKTVNALNYQFCPTDQVVQENIAHFQ